MTPEAMPTTSTRAAAPTVTAPVRRTSLRPRGPDHHDHDGALEREHDGMRPVGVGGEDLEDDDGEH
jgi:hypothetical protein